jgi:hypothetical protein
MVEDGVLLHKTTYTLGIVMLTCSQAKPFGYRGSTSIREAIFSCKFAEKIFIIFFASRKMLQAIFGRF